MAIDLKYSPEKSILTITVVGPIIPEEIAEAFHDIKNSKEYPMHVDALWDLRETDFTGVDEKMLRRIIEKRLDYKERSNIKAAFIVSSDLGFGIIRMYESLSGCQIKRDINVFKSYEEGEDWLIGKRSRQD